eukprot:GHVP01043776.1.p1 GENE.GHVP01043776.1~~GHVP01043776.1.p1  ORF type:complete len:167 (+),score=6.12 GHVP01043776.1:329-829(+)
MLIMFIIIFILNFVDSRTYSRCLTGYVTKTIVISETIREKTTILLTKDDVTLYDKVIETGTITSTFFHQEHLEYTITTTKTSTILVTQGPISTLTSTIHKSFISAKADKTKTYTNLRSTTYITTTTSTETKPRLKTIPYYVSVARIVTATQLPTYTVLTLSSLTFS